MSKYVSGINIQIQTNIWTSEGTVVVVWWWNDKMRRKCMVTGITIDEAIRKVDLFERQIADMPSDETSVQ